MANGLPDYLQDTAKDYAKQATATYSAPIDTSKFTGSQFVAGEDPLQTQAINLATQGVGSYQPYLTAAQANITAQGGLTGGPSGLKWRFFKPREVPKQALIRSPLPGPSYCREDLKWHERTWEPTKAQRDVFGTMSKSFYDHLYKVLRAGAPLFITPEQVGVQVTVMEECHRQNPLSKLRKKGWEKGS